MADMRHAATLGYTEADKKEDVTISTAWDTPRSWSGV